MAYREYIPHIALQPYVDAYWTGGNGTQHTFAATILPDGCVDVMVNLGEDYAAGDGNPMLHGHTYLVGAMTGCRQTIAVPGSKLAAIRFRPGAFSMFFRFDVLHEVTDTTIEFDMAGLPPVFNEEDMPSVFDRFLLNRLGPAKHGLFPVIAAIQNSKGLASVQELQKKYCITARTLERSFRQHTGITPKAFINFVRCRTAYRELKNNHESRSIADIAYSTGFYDHAHLLKEIKRFAGVAPSML